MMNLAATNATNITTALCGACPSCTELSGGSACLWIVALILELLSQPGGSLVTEPQLGDWRVWRLSPFLCGPGSAHHSLRSRSCHLYEADIQKACVATSAYTNEGACVYADGGMGDCIARRDEAAG